MESMGGGDSVLYESHAATRWVWMRFGVAAWRLGGWWLVRIGGPLVGVMDGAGSCASGISTMVVCELELCGSVGWWVGGSRGA